MNLDNYFNIKIMYMYNLSDIIDNKMYFNVLGKEFNRKELKEIFENKSITSNDFNNIPVAGRPCQFKLVSPM